MKLLLVVLAALLVPVVAFAQTPWPSNYFPQATVQRTHEQQKGLLRACYQRNVPAESRKHGDVVKVKITASQTGAVFRVDFLESSYRSSEFEKCVREIFTAIDYGESAPGKTVVVQKLGFQNGADGVRFDPVVPAGGAISQETVTAMAKARQVDIQTCYKSALTTAPELRGQMLVELVIDGSSGRVTSTRLVKSTLGNGTVEQCALGVVGSFAFPIPDDPGLVIVQIPLTFGG